MNAKNSFAFSCCLSNSFYLIVENNEQYSDELRLDSVVILETPEILSRGPIYSSQNMYKITKKYHTNTALKMPNRTRDTENT